MAKGSGRETSCLAVRIRALAGAMRLFLGKKLALYTRSRYFHPFGLKRLYYLKVALKYKGLFGRALTNLYKQ